MCPVWASRMRRPCTTSKHAPITESGRFVTERPYSGVCQNRLPRRAVASSGDERRKGGTFRKEAVREPLGDPSELVRLSAFMAWPLEVRPLEPRLVADFFPGRVLLKPPVVDINTSRIQNPMQIVVFYLRHILLRPCHV